MQCMYLYVEFASKYLYRFLHICCTEQVDWAMVPAVSCTVNEAGVKGSGPSCVRGGLQRAVVGSVAALALQWDRRLRAALTSVAYAIEYLLRMIHM